MFVFLINKVQFNPIQFYYHNPQQKILQERREILINPSNLLEDLDKNPVDLERILPILYISQRIKTVREPGICHSNCIGPENLKRILIPSFQCNLTRMHFNQS